MELLPDKLVSFNTGKKAKDAPFAFFIENILKSIKPSVIV